MSKVVDQVVTSLREASRTDRLEWGEAAQLEKNSFEAAANRAFALHSERLDERVNIEMYALKTSKLEQRSLNLDDFDRLNAERLGIHHPREDNVPIAARRYLQSPAGKEATILTAAAEIITNRSIDQHFDECKKRGQVPPTINTEKMEELEERIARRFHNRLPSTEVLENTTYLRGAHLDINKRPETIELAGRVSDIHELIELKKAWKDPENPAERPFDVTPQPKSNPPNHTTRRRCARSFNAAQQGRRGKGANPNHQPRAPRTDALT